MTWVDVAVFGVLGVSAMLGLLRGLVREVLSIAAWVGAAAAAVWARPYVLEGLAPWLPSDPTVADPIAFGAAFLGALVMLLLLTHAISRSVHRIGLGSLDRSLGLLFGLARGAALVVLAYILVQMVIPIEEWPQPVLAARSLPFAYQGAVWAVSYLPEADRPNLSPPPTADGITIQSLLRTLPRGMALRDASRTPSPGRYQESR
ncbi:MAG: CvpA family protein [Rhodospirillales bacterium]|jgi:membrane protein required for colicin V production|nr:CvpA family protein [Rhodospirillales bacterium]